MKNVWNSNFELINEREKKVALRFTFRLRSPRAYIRTSSNGKNIVQTAKTITRITNMIMIRAHAHLIHHSQLIQKSRRIPDMYTSSPSQSKQYLPLSFSLSRSFARFSYNFTLQRRWKNNNHRYYCGMILQRIILSSNLLFDSIVSKSNASIKREKFSNFENEKEQKKERRKETDFIDNKMKMIFLCKSFENGRCNSFFSCANVECNCVLVAELIHLVCVCVLSPLPSFKTPQIISLSCECSHGILQHNS